MIEAASASDSRFRSLALWRDLSLVGCFARLHFSDNKFGIGVQENEKEEIDFENEENGF